MRTFIGITLFLFLIGAVPAEDGNYTEILRQADRARGNLDGVTWDISVTSMEKDKKDTRIEMVVKARGFDVLAENTAPPKYKGNKVLMLRDNMWFYRPSLSKPVPISKRQKLQGQAAYGDITSTDYADGYDASLLREEACGEETCYVLELKSRNKSNTYDLIHYWVSKGRSVGVKANYFTVSGKLFKSAVMDYENIVELEDGGTQIFISRIVITDELIGTNQTVLAFTDTRLEKLGNYIFNINLLRK